MRGGEVEGQRELRKNEGISPILAGLVASRAYMKSTAATRKAIKKMTTGMASKAPALTRTA